MATHLFDSEIFSDLWTTDEMRAIFDEKQKISSWLEILHVLAKSQAELGIIPKQAAVEICKVATLENLDFKIIRQQFQKTGHSTAGLISMLEEKFPALDFFYFGATVQDLTDTWTVLALRQASKIVYSDLKVLEKLTSTLARKHKSTVMAGRSHGQIGLPITFGLKAASWYAEIHRGLERLKSVYVKLEAGQLSGGVGQITHFPHRAFELQKLFLAKLGLKTPCCSWTSSRDVFGEFANCLALNSSTLDRVGKEIYNLQRTEIGEVSEGHDSHQIGSITMPHKLNPERAEHLGTLAHLIRSQAQTILNSLTHEHERDGRNWKVEWYTLPDLCILMGAQLHQAIQLLSALEIHEHKMTENLNLANGFIYSEPLLIQLAGKIGLRRARAHLASLIQNCRQKQVRFEIAARNDDLIKSHFPNTELDEIFDLSRLTQGCVTMVENILSLKNEWDVQDDTFASSQGIC